MRILMVTTRYGDQLVGGAENLARALAIHAAQSGIDVEVATTCAADNERWTNAVAAGETIEDGLLIRRFRVSPRAERPHGELHARLMREGTLGPLDEADFLGSSVWSADMQRFIDEEAEGYDAIVFTPYLFGTTFFGAQSWPERTIVIPCLHDEPYAHMPAIQAMLRRVGALMFNARGEQRLAERLLGPVRGSVVGMGFDQPQSSPGPGLGDGRHPYFIYAGRLEQGKRVHVVAEMFADYARRHNPEIRLMLIGRGSWRPPEHTRPFVQHVGFLDDQAKRGALAGARALINPSELESFSIVLLEAWLEGTPGIVAAGSEVMRDHCEDSGGGIAFQDQAQFDAALDLLLSDPVAAGAMGEAGRSYVLSQYSWPQVIARFTAAIESLQVNA